MSYLMTPRGVTWNYAVEGDGEALIFIHGWGADRRVWSAQAEYFKKNYKVVTFDLPGHGQSGWTPMELEDIVQDLNFLFKAFKIIPDNFIASSMGALVALKYFAMHECPAKRFVFIGALPKFAGSKEYPFGLPVPRIRKLKAQVREDFPEILNVFFRSLFTINERKILRIKWLQMFNRSAEWPDQDALEKYLFILEKEDLRTVLPRLTMPVLLLNGDQDYICSLESLRHFQSYLPGAGTHIFKGCGHFPFLSKPREFNLVVGKFLTVTTPGVVTVKEGL